MRLRPLDVRFFVPDQRRMIAAIQPIPDDTNRSVNALYADELLRKYAGWGCIIIGEQKPYRWRAGGALLPNQTVKYWKELS